MKVCIVGSMNIDHVMFLETFPIEGETIRAKDYKLFYGGKGANQSVACAKLGLEVGLVACCGNDSQGDVYMNQLDLLNINTHMIKRSIAHTGVAFIEVDAFGENKIITHGGANYDLDMYWIKDISSELLSYDIFLFSLEIPSDIVIYLMRLLKSHNKLIVLDPAPISNFKDDMVEFVDYITPNITEYNVLKSMMNLNHTKVIKKMGSSGSALMDGISSHYKEAYQVKTIDSVGAGDTFNAGIAYGILHKYKPEELLTFANSAGALATTKFGAQTGMPTVDEVNRLIKKG